jgi:Tfp pilus assembly protein FimV
MLESPLLAAGLAMVVLGLAAAILLPGLLGRGAATPTSGAGAATPTPPPASPTFLRPTPSPEPTFLAYIVKSGDSLNSIAKKFHTTARSISWWSRGAHPSLDPESPSYAPNRLQLGWVLQVLPDTVIDENNPPPAGQGG